MTEIEATLRGAERARRLTAAENARILGRLAASESTTDAVIELETHGKPTRGRNGRRRFAAAAALCLVLVGVASLLQQNESDVETTAPPLVDQQLSVVCADSIASLIDALDTWHGLDNWLLSNGSEPNAATALADTWTALAEIDRFRGEATAVLDSLAVMAVAPADEPVVARLELSERQRAAAFDGSARLVELLRSNPTPGCAADSLERALAGRQ